MKRSLVRLEFVCLVATAFCLASCSREPKKQQIQAALAACGAEEHARIVEGSLDGDSPLTVDFDTTGTQVEAQMDCVADVVERMGYKPPTIYGGG